MRHKLSDIVWLDFETFYSNEFSLKKKVYNTSSYVRSPLFKVHCVAVRDGPRKPSVWYEHSDIPRAFKKHGLAGRPVCCHNTQFDGFILSQIYDLVPPYYYDTLAMARGLHGTLTRNDLDTVGLMYGVGGKKPNVLRKVKGIRDLHLPEHAALLGILGDYCANDNDRCYDISRIQLPVYPNDELDLIDWTTRAFCDPVLRVDQALAQEEYDEQIARKTDKQVVAGVSPALLQSADLFAEALRVLGVEPPTKISKTTGEITYAFSKQDWAFTDMLNWEDRPDVVALVEARLATKSTIGETRAKRFLDIGALTLPVGNNYCAAHTTRWGGGNKMNLQNLNRPQYDENKKKIPGTGRLRESILAPPGHMVGVSDSGQIEARLNAWFNDQLDLVETFRAYDRKEGPDPYRVQATHNYGKDINDITSSERFVGKTCVLGLGYQMGPPRLRAQLAMGIGGPAVDIDDAEAVRLVSVYRNVNDKIVEGWEWGKSVLVDMINERNGSKKCIEWDGKDKTIWLPNGLGLHYYGLAGVEDEYSKGYSNFMYRERKKVIYTYGGKIIENLMQALGRAIVAEQLLVIDKTLKKEFVKRRTDVARVVGMTHDENIAVFPERYAKAAQEMMLHEMTIAPKWASGIPLASDGGYDVRYSK
jgi:DNA polymerase